MRRNKPITINSHENFFNKMEEIRKAIKKRNGMSLSQPQLTNLISKQIKIPKLKNLGVFNETNKKKR